MMDYLHIGSCPPDEECVSVVSDWDNGPSMKAECRAYITALRNFLGHEPPGARLRVLCQPHDFGSYYEVVCDYEPRNEKAQDYAFKCEGAGPQTWEEGKLKVTLVPVVQGSLRIEKVIVEEIA